MILNNKQKEKLLRYVPNAKKYMEDDDLGELLTQLDNVILGQGMEEDYELNKLGLELQKMYDEIFYQNQ